MDDLTAENEKLKIQVYQLSKKNRSPNRSYIRIEKRNYATATISADLTSDTISKGEAVDSLVEIFAETETPMLRFEEITRRICILAAKIFDILDIPCA